jgi:hypothetical protein
MYDRLLPLFSLLIPQLSYSLLQPLNRIIATLNMVRDVVQNILGHRQRTRTLVDWHFQATG